MSGKAGCFTHCKYKSSITLRVIYLLCAPINVGDRVESALKDMALLMKHLNRSDEAIEAINSFRHLRPSNSQESVDNIYCDVLYFLPMMHL
ncbi:hypothetical protein RYX36_037108 [Vicia faba]